MSQSKDQGLGGGMGWGGGGKETKVQNDGHWGPNWHEFAPPLGSTFQMLARACRCLQNEVLSHFPARNDPNIVEIFNVRLKEWDYLVPQ